MSLKAILLLKIINFSDDFSLQFFFNFFIFFSEKIVIKILNHISNCLQISNMIKVEIPRFKFDISLVLIIPNALELFKRLKKNSSRQKRTIMITNNDTVIFSFPRYSCSHSLSRSIPVPFPFKINYFLLNFKIYFTI